MHKKWMLIPALVVFLISSAPAECHANAARIVRGAAKTVGSVFEIPIAMIQDSQRMVFPLGIVTGAVRGSLKTVAGTLGGALDMATGAAPYAKYLLLI